MKVVIADGFHEADYIISLFNTRKNDLVVINDDADICHYLSLNNDIPIMQGRCTRESDLREAGAEDCDLFIALSQDDHKNYVACKTARQLLNAKRCIATVSNPKNVAIFTKLGIDSVVSSTYLLGERIRNITSVENMIESLSLEDNKIFIVEIMVSDEYSIVGKTLSQINIADKATVSTIMRDGKALIPNGQTKIMAGDRVLIVTTKENREEILAIFQRKG